MCGALRTGRITSTGMDKCLHILRRSQPSELFHADSANEVAPADQPVVRRAEIELATNRIVLGDHHRTGPDEVTGTTKPVVADRRMRGDRILLRHPAHDPVTGLGIAPPAPCALEGQ